VALRHQAVNHGIPAPLLSTLEQALVLTHCSNSAGSVPASDGSSTLFLCADGSWAMPPGSNGGTRWWSGDGTPGLLPDARAGDFYLDTTSGDLYALTA